MVRAIVGANWGDEGKGKITDMLAKESDIIIRFQGGSNAGHTIINNYGRFALHLLPSGVFYGHTTSIIGNGVALNIPFLVKELESLVSQGLSVVFLALICLALAIMVISKILRSVVSDGAKAPAAAQKAAPAVSDEADKELLAVLMATIGDDLGLPTDKFKILSVTEVK